MFHQQECKVTCQCFIEYEPRSHGCVSFITYLILSFFPFGQGQSHAGHFRKFPARFLDQKSGKNDNLVILERTIRIIKRNKRRFINMKRRKKMKRKIRSKRKKPFLMTLTGLNVYAKRKRRNL